MSVEIADVAPEDLPEPDASIDAGVIWLPEPHELDFIREVETSFAEESPPETATKQVSNAGHAAVVRARSQLGVSESPLGSNCGIPHERYVKWMAGRGTPCVPWCAYFVGWAFDTSTSGNKDGRAPWGESGYVPWIYSWASRSGKLVRSPAHGDVFFLNPTHPTNSHMGLVAGANPANKRIYTVEGNWGNRVLAQLRNYAAGSYAFARL